YWLLVLVDGNRSSSVRNPAVGRRCIRLPGRRNQLVDSREHRRNYVCLGQSTGSTGVIHADFITNELHARFALIHRRLSLRHPELHLGTAGADLHANYVWTTAGPFIKSGNVYLMPMLDISRTPDIVDN